MRLGASPPALTDRAEMRLVGVQHPYLEIAIVHNAKIFHRYAPRQTERRCSSASTMHVSSLMRRSDSAIQDRVISICGPIPHEDQPRTPRSVIGLFCSFSVAILARRCAMYVSMFMAIPPTQNGNCKQQ